MSSSVVKEGEDDSAFAAWLSTWGVVSAFLGTLALLQASTLGFKAVTISLAVAGLLVAGCGFWTLGAKLRQLDMVWLALSAAFNLVLLSLTLFLPGVLNRWWEIGQAPNTIDADQRFAVPRDRAADEGRPLGEGDSADASSEAIRQERVLIRIESVKIGRVGGKGPDCLLVHMRLVTESQGQGVPFEGFASAQHQPTLTDETGQSFSFQEQRVRKQAKGTPVFDVSPPGGLEFSSSSPLGLLLVFSSPPKTLGPMRLELPSAAWGRKGTCRFRIPGAFDAGPPDRKKMSL
jgi:hypothetical protein